MNLRKKIDSKIINFFKPENKFMHFQELNFILSDQELPKEIIGEILNQLNLTGDTKDLIRMTQVNKQFYTFINGIINNVIDELLSGRKQDPKMSAAIVSRKLLPPIQLSVHIIAWALSDYSPETQHFRELNNDENYIRLPNTARNYELLNQRFRQALMLNLAISAYGISRLLKDIMLQNKMNIDWLTFLTATIWLPILLIPLIIFALTEKIRDIEERLPQVRKEHHKIFGDKLKEIDFAPTTTRSLTTKTPTLS